MLLIAQEKMMDVMRICLILFTTIVIFGANGCNNSRIIDSAIKKTGAGIYFFEQGQYQDAKLNCQEAIRLWEMIRHSHTLSYPDWAADNNITHCQDIIDATPIPEALNASAVVPIRIKQNRIFVDAWLDETQNATLLLDTGATTTVLTPEMAEKIGIAPDEASVKSTVYLVGDIKIEVPFVILPQISIGEATVRNLRVGVYSVDPNRHQTDGILGEDFLSHYKVSIDHQAGKLTLKSR